MTLKSRNKTYGRKKNTNDLTSFFSNLTLSATSNDDVPPTPKDSQVLRSVSGNEIAKQPRPDKDSTDIYDIPGDDESGHQSNGTGPTQASAASKRIVSAARRLGSKKTDRSPSTANDPVWAALEEMLLLPYVSSEILEFASQFEIWSSSFNIAKIAQGSYATIFRFSLPSDDTTYTVWKLMPLRPRHGKGSRQDEATFVDDALAELKLLEGMSRSAGFVEFRSARVLQGKVPEKILKIDTEWRKKLCEAERDELVSLGERDVSAEQLWLIVEMTDAGTDLETLLRERQIRRPKTQKFPLSASEAWDIFWGCVEALAHGEEHSQFEHRDLHPGNVCVKERGASSVESSFNGQQLLVSRFTNIEVTLIDYTLSRAGLDLADTISSADETMPQKESLAHNLHNTLFEQHSQNRRDEMQYETYRGMRDIMHYHHKGAKRKQGWQTYMPETNILWLHHILTILLEESGLQSPKAKLGSMCDSEDKSVAEQLLTIREAISPESLWEWTYCSATDLLVEECLPAKPDDRFWL